MPLTDRLDDRFELDRQMLLETLTGTMRNVITFLPNGFQFDLFRLGKDPHHRIIFDRRIRFEVLELNRKVWLPTAEDIVVQKLRWGRGRDIEDVTNVIAVQDAALDLEYVRAWTDQHDTTALLDNIIRSIPSQGDRT